MAEEKGKKREFGDGIEFDDVENFSTQPQQFSHQVLIMRCLTKCVDYGMIEMVEGKVETKVDKDGNITTKYLPDTRMQFIEAVKTSKNFLKCDFDVDAEKEIKSLLGKIGEIKKKWLDKEFNWWETITWELKQGLTNNGKEVISGMHNQKLHFKDASISEELELWRLILEELNLLTKRLDFYEQTTFIG